MGTGSEPNSGDDAALSADDSVPVPISVRAIVLGRR